MKKIFLIFINCLLIIFCTAFFAFAAEVKSAATPGSAVTANAVAAKQQQPPPVNVPASAQALKKPALPVAAVPVPAKDQKQKALPPSANPPAADTYSYNPSGKPDPFRPFIVIETAPKPKQQTAAKKTKTSIFPLQRAETTSYKVVGIVGNEDHRVAIAEDSAKKFYPLLIGTKIGLNDGRVVEILADRVIVEEYDNKKEKRVTLKLYKN